MFNILGAWNVRKMKMQKLDSVASDDIDYYY